MLVATHVSDPNTCRGVQVPLFGKHHSKTPLDQGQSPVVAAHAIANSPATRPTTAVVRRTHATSCNATRGRPRVSLFTRSKKLSKRKI